MDTLLFPLLSNVDGHWFHITADTIVFAQQFNQDVLGDITKGWNHFIQTGQWVALIIGFILGYLFRSVTNG